MRKLPSRSLVLLAGAIFSTSLLTACGDMSNKVITTREDLVITPAPPSRFVPFHHPTEADGDGWNPEEYANKLPLKSAPPGVEAKIESFNVLTSGWTKGGLRYNMQPRGNFSDPPNMTFPELNDNGNLGPVSAGFLYLYYKYEPEITFSGDLTKCCYGSMATAFMDGTSKTEPIIFKDWPIRNDEIGREWHYNSSEPLAEWKKKFPVVAVENKTIRWIDCLGGPGGSMGVGWEGKKIYVLIYAGVDKTINQAKIFRVDYPEGKKPTMTEIPSMEALMKETTSVKYSPDKLVI